MRMINWRPLLTCVVVLLTMGHIPRISAQEASLNIEEALSVYRSAVRQGDATAKALRSRNVDRASADEAHGEAFRSALWEGLKLVRPKATVDERASMAGLISAGKMLADASSGAALADYILAGMDVDEIVEVSIEKDADQAFRLGYGQALNRQRVLPAK